MNLRYRDERRVRGGKSGMEGERLTTSQRLAAFAALAGGRYAWAKLSRAASVGRWADEPTHTARHRAWRLIQVAELAHGAASLANFITFLRDGKFRSPWERAARARLVYAAPDAARVVSFEYLNRQLVWQELSELALFVLPIVSAHARRWREAARGGRRAARRRRRERARRRARRRRTVPPPAPSQRPTTAPCVACARSPVTHPFVLEPCGHVVCYYCAAAARRRRRATARGSGARSAAPRRAGCGAPSTRRASHETRRVGNSYNSNTRIEREASTARARPPASVSRFAFFFRFFVSRFSVWKNVLQRDASAALGRTSPDDHLGFVQELVLRDLQVVRRRPLADPAGRVVVEPWHGRTSRCSRRRC